MINTQEFGDFLQSVGLKDFIGVPCSYLAPLINYAINNNVFIMSNNEGDAVAIASGISMALSKSYGVVLMQNSGLSNALSPLTSLNYTFDIPILGFVSLRGERDCEGKNTDEPQHELLGIITDKILNVCAIHYAFLEDNIQTAKEQIRTALQILEQNKSFFFIIKNKTFDTVKLNSHYVLPYAKTLAQKHKTNTTKDNYPTRMQALEVLHTLALNASALLLATTGKCGRELYEIRDTSNQFYMVGSMGCVSSLSLGIALKTHRKVIAIDGDSALLMRLGALSTNAYYAQKRDNFCHILLDNESHDSTGGQFNLSPFVDFAYIAKGCGYANVYEAENLKTFKTYVQDFLHTQDVGAWFIVLKVAKGSKQNLGRPKITPKDVAKRLKHFIAFEKSDH